MNTRIIPAMLLLLGFGVSAQAQTQEKEKTTPKEKKENIIIRKKEGDKEKLTIVIDGDKITINGKPIEDMKDADIEVLRNKNIVSMIPRIRARVAPMGSLKMFGDGPANRPLLGVVSEKNDKGAKIISVNDESAAEKAGLKKDDIITKVGDKSIDGSEGLYNTISSHQPGEKVSITYLRDGKEATTSATLGKTGPARIRQFNFDDGNINLDMNGMEGLRNLKGMRDMDQFFIRKPKLGLEIQDLEEGKGVKILDVDGDSPAAKAGLQKDDTITEIDGKAVTSVDDLKTHLKEWKEGDSAKITYLRNGNSQTTTVKFPKKTKNSRPVRNIEHFS